MIVADLIAQTAAEGGCRFSFELLPPLKGDGTQGVFGAIDPLVEFDPAYIDVTFHREVMHTKTFADGRSERHVARRRPGTVGISAAIRERYGIETVPHIICGGLSRYDIEDMLIDMDFLGLHNVLALRGDKSPDEAYFTPHPQGHAHAIDLIHQITAMNRGEFVDGEVEECHHSEFSIGVAGYPEKHSDATSLDEDIAYLKAKVDAGARYVVTQLFFDNAKFLDYRERCRKTGITVPIVPGIKPLAVARHLEILPKIFGTEIPEDLAREVRLHIDNPKAVREIGTEWCIAQCRELKAAGVPVLHFYTMSRTEEIAKIARSVF